jgi:predicted RNA binding protein YcfA (HicA-like mRNA interferase family)
MEPGCRDHIAQLKADKTNQTFRDLAGILAAHGFVMHRRKRGSHRAFSRPGCFTSPSIPEGRGALLPAYVRSVIRALEEICDE